MKKHGFTLTEGLITMGILGVIAALTIPTVVDEHNKKMYSSMLSTNVSNIETAMSALIELESANDLFATSAWTGRSKTLEDLEALEAEDRIKFEEGLKVFQEGQGAVRKSNARNSGHTSNALINSDLKATDMTSKELEAKEYVSIQTQRRMQTLEQINKNLMYTLSQTITFLDFNDNINDYYPNGISTLGGTKNERASSTEGFSNDMIVFITKNGSAVIMDFARKKDTFGTPFTESEVNRVHTALTSIAAKVIIDVNGQKLPNKVGRDIFYFALGSDGVLYPYGSKDVGFVLEESVNQSWENSNSSYACINNSIAEPGWGCTARLLTNGYKMDY